MDTVRIRRPEVSDLNELNIFFEIMIKDTFSKNGFGDELEGIKRELDDKIKYISEDFNTKGKERFFLIACCNDEIVGTIAAGPCSELIRGGTNGELSDVLEIGTVFVKPEFQFKGIGNLLLNAMYLALIGRGVEAVSIDSGYPSAQTIWLKKYGEPNYVMKDQWGEGYDHMIWYMQIADIEISFKM